MLIPHIAYWGTKFLWRGEINFQTSAEWDRFFDDYQTWIVQMARLAEAHGAKTFCIGLEFTYAQKFDDRWRKIIRRDPAGLSRPAHLRGNWDSFQEVTFWDALDYIGVLAYFPLTKSESPTRAEIAEAWRRKCLSSLLFAGARKQEVPLCGDRLQRKCAGRRRTVGIQDGRQRRSQGSADPYRCRTRSPAHLSDNCR